MDILVSKTDKTEPHLWSEGYATNSVSIVVDENLPLSYQRGVIIHEIIETYCKFLSHEKVVELTGYIEDGLNQLEENSKG